MSEIGSIPDLERELTAAHKSLRRHGRFIAVAVALTLALTACSSAPKASLEASSSSTAGVTVITAAVENDSKPLSYTDDNGTLTGYEVDLFKAIDAALPDYTVKIESVGADATSIGLDTGRYQVIGGGLYATTKRQATYLLPGPAGASAVQIYKKKGAPYQSLSDLVGKNVAPVTPSGGIYNLLTTWNTDHPSAQIKIQTSDSVTQAQLLQGVNDGTYDAVVRPSNLGEGDLITKLGLNVVTADKPVVVNKTFLAVAKSNATLNDALNSALTKLKADGTLSKLSKQYFGEDVTVYLS
jgi:L-cystine transport system substrate-binding protein